MKNYMNVSNRSIEINKEDIFNQFSNNKQDFVNIRIENYKDFKLKYKIDDESKFIQFINSEINEWLNYWNLLSLNHNFLFINDPNNFSIDKLFFIYKVDSVCNKDSKLSLNLLDCILAVLIFDFKSVSLNAGWTASCLINFILNPCLSTTDNISLSSFLKSKNWSSFILNLALEHGIKKNEFSFAVISLPLNHITKSLGKKLGKSYTIRKITKMYLKENSFWLVYRKYFDEKPIYKKKKDFQYINKIHFYWINTLFDAKHVPKILFNKMRLAEILYELYSKDINPFSLYIDYSKGGRSFNNKNLKTNKNSKSSEILIYNWFKYTDFDFSKTSKEEIIKWKRAAKDFEEVLKIKRIYKNLSTFIHKKLDIYNKKRKEIWRKLYKFDSRGGYLKNFGKCFIENLKLFKQIGLKLTPVFSEEKPLSVAFSHLRYHIASTIIETLLTEGSFYAKLFDNNGLLNPEFISSNFIDSIYSGMMTLELKHPSYGWIFGGFIAGRIIKPEPYSHQFIASLLIPSVFRNFGLGQLMVMVGIIYGSIDEHIESFWEDETIRNVATGHITQKVGMETYGIIPNILYDISGLYNKENIFAVSMIRRFRFTNNLLSKILNSESIKKNLKDKWLSTFLENKTLEESLNLLVNKGEFPTVNSIFNIIKFDNR